MIYGIGTDIIEIERIQKSKNSFLQKTFTQQELQYFYQKGSHAEILAGMFAAKEAVAKAIGTGFRGFSPIDIEILHDDKQKPFIKISPKLQSLLEQKKMDTIFYISISHCKSYAIAFVILNCN